MLISLFVSLSPICTLLVLKDSLLWIFFSILSHIIFSLFFSSFWSSWHLFFNDPSVFFLSTILKTHSNHFLGYFQSVPSNLLTMIMSFLPKKPVLFSSFCLAAVFILRRGVRSLTQRNSAPFFSILLRALCFHAHSPSNSLHLILTKMASNVEATVSILMPVWMRKTNTCMDL